MMMLMAPHVSPENLLLVGVIRMGTKRTPGSSASFKDWASEASSFPDAVSEAALAHSDKDKTRAAYKRTVFLKMRGDLMAAWASHIENNQSDIVDLSDARRKKMLS